jgi:protein tyrosine phosphatase
MKVEERDEIAQYFIRTQAKVKELERDFADLIALIDNYKILVINTQIEELKVEKAKRWWQR